MILLCITLHNVCTVHRGMFSTLMVYMSTVGDTVSTPGGVQYAGTYHDECGDIMSTVGCSIHRRIS